MTRRGVFVALEGIDGCGKTTAIRNVAEQLQKLGVECLVTQEHQLNRETGKRINEILTGKSPLVDPAELQKLFILDRKDHVEHVVKPAIERGITVLTDRYWFSTLAYGMLSGSMDEFVSLHRSIMGDDFLIPDITFYLDIPADLAMERIQKTRVSPTHFEKLQKLERVRKNYQTLTEAGIAEVVQIDGVMEPQAVADAIVASLMPRLAALRKPTNTSIEKDHWSR